MRIMNTKVWRYGLRFTNLFNDLRTIPKFTITFKIHSIQAIQTNIKYILGAALLYPVKKMCTLNHELLAEDVININTLNIADNLYADGNLEDSLTLLNDTDRTGHEVEVQWRRCRILYFKSRVDNIEYVDKAKYINEAFIIMSGLVQRHPDHYAVQKWFALILDAKAALQGMAERIKQIETVKKHMILAATINPKDATTLYMIGEMCYQLADMPWHHRKIAELLIASPPRSTYEEALWYFQKAETAQPRFYSLNLLRLGKCYLKLRKFDQAKYYLKLAASYPIKTKDDRVAQSEASSILKCMKVRQ